MHSTSAFSSSWSDDEDSESSSDEEPEEKSSDEEGLEDESSVVEDVEEDEAATVDAQGAVDSALDEDSANDEPFDLDRIETEDLDQYLYPPQSPEQDSDWNLEDPDGFYTQDLAEAVAAWPQPGEESEAREFTFEQDGADLSDSEPPFRAEADEDQPSDLALESTQDDHEDEGEEVEEVEGEEGEGEVEEQDPQLQVEPEVFTLLGVISGEGAVPVPTMDEDFWLPQVEPQQTGPPDIESADATEPGLLAALGVLAGEGTAPAPASTAPTITAAKGSVPVGSQTDEPDEDLPFSQGGGTPLLLADMSDLPVGIPVSNIGGTDSGTPTSPPATPAASGKPSQTQPASEKVPLLQGHVESRQRAPDPEARPQDFKTPPPPQSPERAKLTPDEIAKLDLGGRANELLRRAADKLTDKAKEAIEEMLKPENLAMGAAIGLAVANPLTGPVVGPLMAGWAAVELGEQGVKAVDHLMKFVDLAGRAKTDEELDEAAEHLAEVVAIGGQALLDKLLRKLEKSVGEKLKPKPKEQAEGAEAEGGSSTNGEGRTGQSRDQGQLPPGEGAPVDVSTKRPEPEKVPAETGSGPPPPRSMPGPDPVQDGPATPAATEPGTPGKSPGSQEGSSRGSAGGKGGSKDSGDTAKQLELPFPTSPTSPSVESPTTPPKQPLQPPPTPAKRGPDEIVAAQRTLRKPDGYGGSWPPVPPTGKRYPAGTDEGDDRIYQQYVSDAWKSGEQPRPKSDWIANLRSTRNKMQPPAGYNGGWPPSEPSGVKPSISDPDGIDWRYQRYVYTCYANGEKPLDKSQWHVQNLGPAMRGGRSGRGGGPAQDAARTKLAQEGYTRTENVALGQRVERGRLVPNMVDGVKRHPDGRREYLEVDTVGQDGLPTSRLRNKLKEEIKALKKGEELVYADKENPSLRIVYRYGESPSVVDTRKAEKVKPANPGSKGST